MEECIGQILDPCINAVGECLGEVVTETAPGVGDSLWESAQAVGGCLAGSVKAVSGCLEGSVQAVGECTSYVADAVCSPFCSESNFSEASDPQLPQGDDAIGAPNALEMNRGGVGAVDAVDQNHADPAGIPSDEQVSTNDANEEKPRKSCCLVIVFGSNDESRRSSAPQSNSRRRSKCDSESGNGEVVRRDRLEQDLDGPGRGSNL